MLSLDSRALRAELHSDPELSRLHSDAVAWRRARFGQLMTEEHWRAPCSGGC
ncbi:MAG: hypothetical protein R3D63_08525 [Paracoccaceae bacterium]